MRDVHSVRYLESFMALVIAYSLRPSCSSISLKVPIQPTKKTFDQYIKF